MGADGKPAPGDPPPDDLPEEYKHQWEEPPGLRDEWKDMDRAELVDWVRGHQGKLRDSEYLAREILDGRIPPRCIEEMVRDAPNDPMAREALRRAYRDLRDRALREGANSELLWMLAFGLADLEAGIVPQRKGAPSMPHVRLVRGKLVAIVAWSTGRKPTRAKASTHEESAADIVAEGMMVTFRIAENDYYKHGAPYLHHWRTL